MSSYKLYLHFEGSSASPDFTYIYKSTVNSQDRVRTLLEDFCSRYSQKHGKSLSIKDLHLVAESGKCQAADNQIVKAFERGSDVQVKYASTSRQLLASQVATSTQAASPAGNRSERLATEVALSAHDQHATQLAREHHTARQDDAEHASSAEFCAEVPRASDSKVYLPIIKQFLERAKEAESKKYFRAACKIYEQVTRQRLASTRRLRHSPHPTNRGNCRC